VPDALYLDTSAVLRASLEAGTTPEIEGRIDSAEGLVTSRLSLVESARALLRLRLLRQLPEARIVEAERQIQIIFRRCDVWELTEPVCELASRVAPDKNLRTLDALHLATFLLAGRRIEGLQMLTADRRLEEAAGEG